MVQSVVALYSGREDLASDICVCKFSVHPRPIHATVLTGFLSRGFPIQNDQEICFLVYIYVYV